MADKFLSLKALRDILTDARKDLKNVRDVNATLSRKMAAVNQPQYSREHIVGQVGKLRESARAEASSYVTQARTLEQLSSVRTQADYWNLGAYLARAAVADVGTGDALMRHMILISTLPKLPTEALGAMLQPAIDAGSWPVVAQVYYESQARVKQGDQAAISITASLSERAVPDIAEAKQIVTQARQLEEFTGYALRSIHDGSEDLGLKMEGYQQQWNEREAARAA